MITGVSSSMAFQSTLSMRRATGTIMFDTITVGISIHALHEESDAGTRRVRPRHAISIHALHEESDQKRGS